MVEDVFQTMSTVAQIKVEGNDEISALAEARAIILDCEKKFNYYSKESDISKLTQKINVGERYIISSDLYKILTVAKKVKKETKGLFDVDYNNNDPYKDYHLLNDNIIIFDSNKTKLNLGAIAKGFAADKAIEKLKEFDISRAMISIGGHVTCYTKKDVWRIGLQDPSKEFGHLVGTLEIANESISTSGENYRGKHITNPIEADWASSINSVSVISEDGMLSDAYSTAIFLADEGTRKVLMQKHNIDVIIINNDTIRVSKRLFERVNLKDQRFKKESF